MLLDNFYSAFARGDGKTMTESYHPNAVFSDPAFGELRGAEIGAMWRMLIERSKGKLQIEYSDILDNDFKGSAKWTARYLFTQTGRNVTNHVRATFEFKDGLIFRHTDSFNFHNWAKQALGWKGWLFGGTTFLKKAVRQKARQSLLSFQQKHATG